MLKGQVIQDVYAATNHSSTPLEDCHELIEVTCKPGQEGEPSTLGYVRAQHLVHHTINVGQTYQLSHEAFHQAHSIGPTITLLERGLVVNDVARVLRAPGSAFNCPFSIPVSEQQCWSQIEQMIRS